MLRPHGELIKRTGKTVLLVSHNIRQVERMCSRVLLIDHGKIKMDGPAYNVCNAFYEQSDRMIVSRQAESGKFNIVSTGEVDLLDVHCAGVDGKPVSEVVYGDDVNIVVRINALIALVTPLFVIGIHTSDFVYLTTATSPEELRCSTLPAGTHEVSIRIHHFPLLPGVYSLRVSIDVENPIKNILYGENLCHFSVISTSLQRSASYCEGFFQLNDVQWQLKTA